MARVVSGVLVPTTTTPGQTIVTATPDTGTVFTAAQVSGWLRTFSGSAARLGVVGLFRYDDLHNGAVGLEIAIYGSADYGQGGVCVLPLPGLVADGGKEWVWTHVAAVLANTYWHGAFMYE